MKAVDMFFVDFKPAVYSAVFSVTETKRRNKATTDAVEGSVRSSTVS